MPELTVDELLTTTRAVRKRLDLTRDVDPSLIRDCLELAVQAPSGSNTQDWHFVVVRDPDKRAALARLYARSYARYRESRNYAGRIGDGDPGRAEVQQRVASSADHLAERLHEVPVHLVPCIRPLALAAVKANLNDGERLSFSEQMDREAQRHAVTARTEDAVEAAMAFLEKRAPRFQGR